MKKIWLNRYPDDVPSEINPDNYTSLVDLFNKATERFADKPAFKNMGCEISYRELEQYSRDFAAYLQNDLSLKKGERLALMMPNLLQYPVVLFAALRAGLTVVNVNPLYTERELEKQLKDCGATTVVVLSNFAHSLQKIIANTNIKHIIVTDICDLFPPVKRLLINFVVKYIKKLIPTYQIPNKIPFVSALRKGRKQSFKAPNIHCEDIALLQYTGGTTGISKGAMLTHRNLLANVEQAKACFIPRLTVGEEVIVTALPLYHIFALMVNCLLFMDIGACNLLITNPRDIKGLVKTLAKNHFTALTGVNTLFNALVNSEGFKKLDFSSLHIVVGGGMPIQQPVADSWHKITGTYLLEGYGLTECSPLVAVNPYDLDAYSGSIGLPVASTDIRIVNEKGQEVDVGEAGELWVKGPQVMKGYWNNPEATNEIIFDGWLVTGDIVVMDQQGFIRIVDRKKDMILVSGFNVYPKEIEDLVISHPKVLEVAVIGIPCVNSGEQVKLYIVKKDPSLTEQEIRDFCRSNLTGYKVPRHIEFMTELPKSNVGKILRRELREHALIEK